MAERQRPFFGWAVVAAVFAVLAVAAGLGFYNLTVYLRALTTEKGFSVGAVSGATAAFFLVSGAAGIPVASLIDRYDVRLTIVGGAVLAGSSLALLGRVTELWQLYLLYTVFGLGFAASSLVPGTTVVTRWFTRRRSVALSVASTGLSVGGIALTPLSARLISDHGMGTVAPWLGVAMIAGIVPVAAILVRPEPRSMGLRPDGEPGEPDHESVQVDGIPLRTALRSRFFVAVTGAYVLAMVAQVGGISHLFNLVSERLDEGRAATAVSALAFASVVGRLAGGRAVTPGSMRTFTVVLMVAQFGALLLLASAGSTATVMVAAVGFGLTVGNLLMLHPLLLAEAFGVRDFAAIYSRSQLVMTIGVAFGPTAIGILHDAVHGYGLAMVLAAVASVGAAGTLMAGGPVPTAVRE